MNEMEQVELAALTTAQLFEQHNECRAAITQLRIKQNALHQEITRREHAEAETKRNPDASKDQVVRGK